MNDPVLTRQEALEKALHAILAKGDRPSIRGLQRFAGGRLSFRDLSAFLKNYRKEKTMTHLQRLEQNNVDLETALAKSHPDTGEVETLVDEGRALWLKCNSEQVYQVSPKGEDTTPYADALNRANGLQSRGRAKMRSTIQGG